MQVIAEANDEGTATIQWSFPDGTGAMLIVLADGSAAYSVKPVGGYYSANAADMELPEQLVRAIRNGVQSQ